MLQVTLIIALFYTFFQLTAVNFLVFYFGDTQLFIFYNVTISLLLVFILTSYLSITQVFSFNEFQILASLPLTYRKISIAKVVSSILVPIVLTMIIQLPTIWFLLFDMKVIEAIKFIFFLPVVSGSVALFLLFVLSCIHRFYYKFKNNVAYFMTNIAVMVFIPLVFIIYFVRTSTLTVEIDFSSVGGGVIDVAKLILNHIFETASTIPVIDWIIESFVSAEISLSFVLTYIAIGITNFLLLFIIIQNISANYYRNGQSENNKSGLKGSRVYITKNKWSNYLQREIWVIQSEAYFKLQVLLGVLLAPAASAILLFLIKYDVLPEFINITKDASFDIYFSYFVLFWCCMNNISGTPYSREGKYYYLLKSTPINSKYVYFSKVIISSIMSITSIFLSFLLYASFGYWGINSLFMLFIISGLAICYNLLTPLYDMKNPMTEWENPSVAVKSNPNVLISLIYGMPILIVIATIHFCFDWFHVPLLVASLIILLGTIGTVLLLHYLILKRTQGDGTRPLKIQNPE